MIILKLIICLCILAASIGMCISGLTYSSQLRKRRKHVLEFEAKVLSNADRHSDKTPELERKILTNNYDLTALKEHDTEINWYKDTRSSYFSSRSQALDSNQLTEHDWFKDLLRS